MVVLEYVTSVMEIGGRLVPLAAGLATVVGVEARRFVRPAMVILQLVPRAEATDIVLLVTTVTVNVKTVPALARSTYIRSLSPTMEATRKFSFTVRQNGRRRQMPNG